MNYSSEEQSNTGDLIAPVHLSYLVESSGIDPGLIRSEGVESVCDDEEFKAYGFDEKQWAGPGIMLKRRRPGSRDVYDHIYRPDDPRGGLKYLTAKGVPNCLDVPLKAQPHIDDPKVSLLITEGHKKALAYLSRGGRCVINLSGVWGWRGANDKGGKVILADWDSVALNGRDVHLAFDSDAWRKPSVKQALIRLTRNLEGRGARVFWVMLEDAPDGSKVGVDDYLLAHSLDEMMALAVPAPADDLPHVFPYSANGTEQIRIAVEALVSTGSVFRKESGLVEVREGFGGVTEMVRLNEHAVKLLLSDTTKCLKVTGGGQGVPVTNQHILPPTSFAQGVLTAFDQFPQILRVTTTPFFSETGFLVRRAGYDEETQTYLAPDGSYDVPDEPTGQDVAAAMALYEDGLQDFPFDGPASKANALAMALEQYVRPMIPGPTPIYQVTAPTQGAGKGKLANLLLRPALRQDIPWILSAPSTEDEWGKSILTKVREGASVYAVDNVKTALSSGPLAGAVTSQAVSGRNLGALDAVHGKIRWTWVITANNPAVDSDIARRSVNIRLVPKQADPSTRDDFKHPVLERWVKENERRLTVAALTIVQAWVRAGKRPGTGPKFGSFEEWAAVIGGILEHAGVEGFLGNLSEFKETANTEQESWLAFVATWWNRARNGEVTTAQLYDLMVEGNLDLPIYGKDENGRRKSFGKALGRQKDRIYEDVQVVFRVGGGRVKLWQLVPLNGGDESAFSELDVFFPSSPISQPSYTTLPQNDTSYTKCTSQPEGTMFDQRTGATSADRAAD